MKITKEDYIIDYDAEADFIYFIPDRVWARIKETKSCVDSDKEEMIEIIMIVDHELKKKLKLKQDTVSRTYKRKDMLIPPAGKDRVTIALCSFDGKKIEEKIREPLLSMVKELIGYKEK